MDMETQMENTKSPLVSVVIPTKNRKNLLSMAINSVLTQTYKNIKDSACVVPVPCKRPVCNLKEPLSNFENKTLQDR